MSTGTTLSLFFTSLAVILCSFVNMNQASQIGELQTKVKQLETACKIHTQDEHTKVEKE